MSTPQPMLAPVIALVAWTAVMWGWMYATRIPAILRLRIRLDGNLPRGEQMATLPPRVRWKADNYNTFSSSRSCSTPSASVWPCWAIPPLPQ